MKSHQRNKSKDNPYTLGFDEEKNIYTVEFKDNKNILHKVEISEKVYKAFDKFELEDISQIHKVRSHIEHSEVFEETLNTRMLYKPISIEEEVENKVLLDDLKKAINHLTDVQKRRLKLDYKYQVAPNNAITSNRHNDTFAQPQTQSMGATL